MGCSETRDSTPILIFIFEPQNSTQKEYCIKMRDELHPKKSVKFVIESFIKASFKIRLKINGQTNIIEESFDAKKMKDSIKKINKILDESNYYT